MKKQSVQEAVLVVAMVLAVAALAFELVQPSPWMLGIFLALAVIFIVLVIIFDRGSIESAVRDQEHAEALADVQQRAEERGVFDWRKQ